MKSLTKYLLWFIAYLSLSLWFKKTMGFEYSVLSALALIAVNTCYILNNQEKFK